MARSSGQLISAAPVRRRKARRRADGRFRGWILNPGDLNLVHTSRLFAGDLPYLPQGEILRRPTRCSR